MKTVEEIKAEKASLVVTYGLVSALILTPTEDDGDDHDPAAKLEYVIVRKPTRVEYARFVDKRTSDDKAALSGEMHDLVRAVCVAPDKDGVRSLLDKYPAAQGQILAEALRLAGSKAKKV